MSDPPILPSLNLRKYYSGQRDKQDLPTLQKSLTRSGPKVTNPGPRGDGWTPSTPSFVVGSDQRRSMSTTPPSSIVSGLCSCSIWSMRCMDRPMPAEMHRHFSRNSITPNSAAVAPHAKTGIPRLDLDQVCALYLYCTTLSSRQNFV